ncbi:MAG: NUDIX domain-containing protein [Pseudomonadota bacterium]|nr:NUDIX domain-containing protein [Pseudomonadota bacterium]
MSGAAVHVVAAAVIDAVGRVLIAQRPPGKHLAGSWEFPGGKLESGEARALGLARELREELGIAIREPRPLIRVRHTYTYGEVLIDMWVVARYQGEPEGLDGQALRWCRPDELAAADLLPADKPIVRALRLPERLTEAATPYYCVSGLESLLGREGAEAGDAAGGNGRLRGVACVNTAHAVAAAAAGARADFLVLSQTLPAEELAALCQQVPVPVYACGVGLEQAWALGASGLNEIAACRRGPENRGSNPEWTES